MIDYNDIKLHEYIIQLDAEASLEDALINEFNDVFCEVPDSIIQIIIDQMNKNPDFQQAIDNELENIINARSNDYD